MGTPTQVRVPDIGDFKDVEVIEILVAPGSAIQAEEPLITLESDKATLEIPSPEAGIVGEIAVAVGDKVSEGSPILTLEEGAPVKGTAVKDAAEGAQRPPAGSGDLSGSDKSGARETESPPPSAPRVPDEVPSPAPSGSPPHASPSVRKLARELGVDLAGLTGSGRNGRILQEDVEGFAKGNAKEGTGEATPAQTAGARPPGADVPVLVSSDFGPVETRPLSRIQKLSGANLHRTWTEVPHVTHHDLADITDLEAFRQSLREEGAAREVRITLLTFLLKASVAALKAFPDFNASLAPDGENLILKHYYHVGVAVDTPVGLVVPVIRDVDKKGIFQLAEELTAISAKARSKRIAPADLQGGCFTISSLGGIGGTGFTPILNAPEVAILGVAKSSIQPVYVDGEFQPRRMLPLSLSFDHRVIDGANGARFAAFLCSLLGDIRRLLL